MVIQDWRVRIVVKEVRVAYIKGRMMMQRKEKIPWKSEGALQAHVDCHVPVPRVIPAAINAPTLMMI